MDKVANKILQIFIHLVKKDMNEYEEDEKKRYELYHRIKNRLKCGDTADSSNVYVMQYWRLGGMNDE